MSYHISWSFCSHLSRKMGFSIFHPLNLPLAGIFLYLWQLCLKLLCSHCIVLGAVKHFSPSERALYNNFRGLCILKTLLAR